MQNDHNQNLSILILITVGLGLGACASTPKNAALIDAKRAYQQASTTLLITENSAASSILKEAQASLKKADRLYDEKTLWREEIEDTKIDGVANLSLSQTKLARVTAQSNAEAETLLKQKQGELAAAKQRLADAREQKLSIALNRASAAGADVSRNGDKVNVILRDVTFELNKATIKSKYQPLLDNLAEGLTERYPNGQLIVEGHTDISGPEKFNQKLSGERAMAVKQFLENRGISPVRITTKAFGSTKPIVSNDTNEGRMQNRRVEIVFDGRVE